MCGLEWRNLLAHSHWVTFSAKGKSIRVCARCLGVIIGFASFLAAAELFEMKFFSTMPLAYQIPLCLILASPAIFDWVTQTWKLREGSNKARILTGFFEGGGVVFLSMASIPLTEKIFVLILAGSVALNAGFLGRNLKSIASLNRQLLKNSKNF